MLREKVKSAARVLFLRNVVGIALSAFAFTLIFVKLNAEAYAPIVQSQLLLSYAIGIGGMGLEAVVIRSGREISPASIREVYLTSLVGTAVAIIATALLTTITATLPVEIATIIGAAYMIRALSTIPAAQLEANVEFKAQAVSDLASQVINLLALATFLQFSPDASAVAYSILSAQLTYTIFILRANRVLPAWPSIVSIRRHIQQGIAIQYNNWIWQLRDASIPIVLKSQGMDGALGAFGLANQFAQKIGIVRQIAWKIAVPAAAQETDPESRARGLAQGRTILLVLICPAFLLAAVVVYGLEHHNPVRWAGLLAGFSAIGIHIVMNSAFTLQCAGLMAAGRFKRLAFFHTAFVAVFFSALVLSTSLQMPLALVYSEMASIISYGLIISTKRKGGDSSESLLSFLTPTVSCLGLALGAALHNPLPLLAATAMVFSDSRNQKIVASAIRHVTGRLRPLQKK